MTHQRDPGFVSDFNHRNLAVLAINVIVSARKSGLSNKEILNITGLKELFSPKFLDGKTPAQLEWKLKNMARDLRFSKLSTLDVEWHEAKTFFEGLNRSKDNTNV